MQDGLKTNRQTKNSVFTGIFSEKANILQLYKELHPEDTDVTVDDITVQTLETVLAYTLYNDLGFLVRDQFILLFEAQSSWNQNITLRIFFYLSETYKRYLTDSRQSEHAARRVHLPKPVLYVVYTGNQSIPDEISLNEEYFGGDAPIDLRIRVLKQTDASTLHGQYIGFCRVYDEQQKLYKNSIRCAEETVRICIEKGYLTEYLKKHRNEVVSMLAELFDEKTIRESYESALQADYMERGRAEGEAKGKIQSMLNIARNMLLRGKDSLEDIAALTGLSIDRVRELANQPNPPAP